jgi:hypothetical protein
MLTVWCSTQQAAPAVPAQNAGEKEKEKEREKEEGAARKRADAEDKRKHEHAAEAEAKAKQAAAVEAQYEVKLQLMEEVMEHKERELWDTRKRCEKLAGLGVDDLTVQELEELEGELLKALVRVKTVKKKKMKEDRDSTKMDLLQVCTPPPHPTHTLWDYC